MFYLRRFFRIYPPDLLALLFFARALPVSRLPLAFPRYSFADLFTHGTLTHNYFPRSIYKINGAFWSIAVEAQLYLIYPLLLTLVRRIGWNKSLLFTLLLEINLLGFLPFFKAVRMSGTYFS